MKATPAALEQLKKSTDTDAIIEYMRGNAGQLSDKQKELLDRYDFADNQIRGLVKESEVAEMLQTKFGISRATAYRDIIATKRVFGSITRQEKEYYRRLVIELCAEAFKLGRAQKDGKVMNGALGNLIKAANLTQTDMDMPDFEALLPHEYELVLPHFSMEFIAKALSQGTFNLVDLLDKSPAKHLDITHLQNPNPSLSSTPANGLSAPSTPE